MKKTINPRRKNRWAIVFPAIYPDAYMSLHNTRADARKAQKAENKAHGCRIAFVVDRGT